MAHFLNYKEESQLGLLWAALPSLRFVEMVMCLLVLLL